MSSQAQSYAYGVAMGLNVAEFECPACGKAKRWGNATPTGWIECTAILTTLGATCGQPLDTLTIVDDPQVARALQVLARNRYA